MASATPSVEKSESAAVAASLSASPAASVKGARPKKSGKVKAAAAVVAATQALEEAELLSNLTLDHPYLSVLYKRLRSHRKKLEKIKGLEAAQAAGDKRLNAQQLELMGSKAALEKLVAELELLREQFVGVFSQELAQKQQQEEKAGKEEDVAPSAEQIEAAQQVQETEQSEQVAEQQEAALEEPQEPQESQEKTEEDFAHVYELLKTLHVVNLHQALGKEVPMVLDFFSKVLLGNTRPPAELSYEENLMESLDEAKKYLTDSDKVFACDTTYSGLRAFVDQLANVSSGKPEEDQKEVAEEEGEEAVEEPVEEEVVAVEEASDVPVVPAEINTMPEISFFTESQLESEQGDEVVDEVERSEVIVAQEEVDEAVSTDIQVEVEEEIIEQNGVEIGEQVEVAVEAAPAPESVPAPPLSFAAVAAGLSSERTPSPSGSSGSSGQEKKEAGSEDNSPRGKNPQRRRGQNRRWKEKGEKGSNSNSGNKPADGSPTNGAKPRRPRAPRTNDENSGAQGAKNNKSKEGRRPRVDRGLRKQGNNSQQHAAPMIAPHA
ncbi:methyltransferase TARBP1 [Phytophthora cinnamomi]|uniref:methyltransferase TARBP1 n=1 Tax=Phytophthora cinnamomi TaxID=4785 RepID=UPI00355A5FA3|nr:methyltransferase TARBP1 [Phytophthora cinnamomi]